MVIYTPEIQGSIQETFASILAAGPVFRGRWEKEVVSPANS